MHLLSVTLFIVLFGASSPAVAHRATPRIASGVPTEHPLSPQGDDSATEVVLRINGEAVTRRRFEDWLLLNRGELDAPLLARTLRLRTKAEALGLSLTEEEVRRRAREEVERRLWGAFAGDRVAWEAELAREGRTSAGRIAERAITIEAELLLEAILQRGTSIAEADLRALWEERYGPGGREPKVRLLRKRFVVPFEPGENTQTRRARTQRLRDEAQRTMERLLARARGGEDFERLLEAESDHPSRATGGRPVDDSWRHGFPRAPLERLARSEVGEYSEPIYAGGAFWILRVEDIEVTPLESVRRELEAELQRRSAADNRGAEELLADLRRELPLELSSFLQEPSEAAPAQVLLKVGTREITRAEFAPWLMRLEGESQAQRFALETRLRRLAAAAGIEISAADIAAGVARARATDIQLSGRGGETAWLEGLGSRGLSEAAWGRAAGRRIELEGFEDALARARRTLSEAELRLAWEETYGPDGVRLRVRWIQLSVPPLPVDLPLERRQAELERLQQETLGRAEALLRRVQAGEDFGALAQVHSVDAATAARGGAPADDFSTDSLPPELHSQLEGLDAMDMTRPTLLESGQAVVLLQLVARERTPFDTARPELEQRLMALPATHVERAAIRAEIARDLDVRIETQLLIR